MVDFTQKSLQAVDLSEIITLHIDSAMLAKQKADYEQGRGSGQGDIAAKRIGAGYIGTACARELAFRFHKAPKEDRPSVVSKGELQRHAEAGHWTEAKMVEWMRLAGFAVQTCKVTRDGTPILGSDGKPKQIGWMACQDKDTGQYQMAGEVDGVITYVPVEIMTALGTTDQVPLPWIWESKKATDKKWKKFSKEGVKKADPKYYGQLQMNMAYLDVRFTLFSMLNLDNMKPYWELVPLDLTTAQKLSDRAVTIIQSRQAEELPRLGRDEADFVCKFCDFKTRCWHPELAPPIPVEPTSITPPSQATAEAARTFNPSWQINP